MSLKLLCLHGHQQNARVFRTKLGRLPHKLRHVVGGVTILDGPLIVPPSLSTSEDSDTASATVAATATQVSGEGGDSFSVEEQRSWFRRLAPGSDEIDMQTVSDALTAVEKCWQEEGPFDGILGFSMGGTVAALASSEANSSRYPGLRFVICIGAPDVPPLFEDSNPSEKIASLHIAGETDTAVVVERSWKLADRFKSNDRWSHPQGHCIPTRAEYTQKIVDFVNKQAS